VDTPKLKLTRSRTLDGLKVKLQAGTEVEEQMIEQVYDGIFGFIVEALESGRSVALPGIGVLKIKNHAPGLVKGFGEKYHTVGGKRVKFRMSKAMKENLNKDDEASVLDELMGNLGGD